ncbi:dephospho-CoA kinase [Campylobacter fetus]|nr:dephospho-CoA kinase [Campylobacter fetus]EJU9540453.1 dephospho-CoA kinase [Campylobacter fetus]
MNSKFRNAYVITGNIGSGKSTVVNMLKLYGFSVIDADKISHDVLDKSSDKIAKEFGKEFVSGSNVDRKKLGALVFKDREKLKLLESILHPQIRSIIYEKAHFLEDKGLPYFIDIPLYFEKNAYNFDKVVLIYAPEHILLHRVISRDRLSKEDAKLRLSTQIDIEEKVAKSQFVIKNDDNLKNLNLELNNFIEKLKENYATLEI